MDDILAHMHGIQGYDAIAGFSLLSNTSSSYSGFYFLHLIRGRSATAMNCPPTGSCGL